MAKQVFLSKDGKPVSIETERLRGERLGKSTMSSGTIDFASKASSGYRVTLTTTPRDLVRKDKLRQNIRKRSQEIVGILPIIFPATSTGLLVLEFESGEEGKIIDALAKAIQETKFSGFWIF